MLYFLKVFLKSVYVAVNRAIVPIACGHNHKRKSCMYFYLSILLFYFTCVEVFGTKFKYLHTIGKLINYFLFIGKLWFALFHNFASPSLTLLFERLWLASKSF